MSDEHIESISDDQFSAILLHEGRKTLQIKGPYPLRASDRFTLFWRGFVAPHILHSLVNEVAIDSNDKIKSIYYFPDFKQEFPIKPLYRMPDENETLLVNEKGTPKYCLWASIATEEQIIPEKIVQKNVGILTGIQFLESHDGHQAIEKLIVGTAKPDLGTYVTLSLMNDCRQILNKNMLIQELEI